MLEFDVDKTVQYWTESAEYDMGVADALYQTGKYPYALFMGHLAMEKLLKSLVVKNTREHAPLTHLREKLARKSKAEIPEETNIKLREFMEFHFEARYPSEQNAFYKKFTKTYTDKNLKEIKKQLTSNSIKGR